MLDDKEIEKIIQDIDNGMKDGPIGKKYNHSHNTIADIREKHEAKKQGKKEEGLEQNINVDDLQDMGTQMEYKKEIAPTRAQIEEAKIKKHSERLADELEKRLDEDEEDTVRGRQQREAEEKQKIIAEYHKETIQPRFDNDIWFTSETVEEFIGPRDREIADLKGQISQLNINHTSEISQLNIDHASELKKVKEETRNKSYWEGVFAEQKKGDQIFCYVCGQPMSKAQLWIPCANCYNQRWPLQARQPVITQPIF